MKFKLCHDHVDASKCAANSSWNISVVSESKFERRTSLRFRATSCFLASTTNYFNARKNTLAQRGFGKPKMPEEMAGMETDWHLS